MASFPIARAQKRAELMELLKRNMPAALEGRTLTELERTPFSVLRKDAADGAAIRLKTDLNFRRRALSRISDEGLRARVATMLDQLSVDDLRLVSGRELDVQVAVGEGELSVSTEDLSDGERAAATELTSGERWHVAEEAKTQLHQMAAKQIKAALYEVDVKSFDSPDKLGEAIRTEVSRRLAATATSGDAAITFDVGDGKLALVKEVVVGRVKFKISFPLYAIATGVAGFAIGQSHSPPSSSPSSSKKSSDKEKDQVINEELVRRKAEFVLHSVYDTDDLLFFKHSLGRDQLLSFESTTKGMEVELPTK